MVDVSRIRVNLGQRQFKEPQVVTLFMASLNPTLAMFPSFGRARPHRRMLSEYVTGEVNYRTTYCRTECHMQMVKDFENMKQKKLSDDRQITRVSNPTARKVFGPKEYKYVVESKCFRPDQLFKVTEIKQRCYFSTQSPLQMALHVPHSIFHLALLLYIRPETFGPYYVYA